MMASIRRRMISTAPEERPPGVIIDLPNAAPEVCDALELWAGEQLLRRLAIRPVRIEGEELSPAAWSVGGMVLENYIGLRTLLVTGDPGDVALFYQGYLWACVRHGMAEFNLQ